MAISKTTKKWLVISAIIVGVLAGAWVIFKKLKSNKSNKEIADQAAAIESGLTFPIKKGNGYDNAIENDAVLLIQRWINYAGVSGMSIIAEDGKFGEETEYNLWFLTNVTEVDQEFFDQMKTELGIA